MLADVGSKPVIPGNVFHQENRGTSLFSGSHRKIYVGVESMLCWGWGEETPLSAGTSSRMVLSILLPFSLSQRRISANSCPFKKNTKKPRSCSFPFYSLPFSLKFHSQGTKLSLTCLVYAPPPSGSVQRGTFGFLH
jgi:hypothetical protein